ncbi:MKI67 FHA domain-interacting nucleolar phosphoprotein-like [Ischnura elegans]|uniref:MKI67 FHA domain-interacting nucleolar phosphoprotein-like n=1 Tax=Ischnura elegans TaxID=197161 RepID=UPI001ED8BD15|nr:MKI67 FHA domain-interacting nucleolar phosphoprotein-like [Ischnura elegans]
MNLNSISLKKEQQSSFDSAVKRLRKKVKDGDIGLHGDSPKSRGVVRLSRIPHGFYEEEMRRYFSQFGVVTRLRLVRSKKTGNSKGFAFVEFAVPEVAKVVAETMNNYLMFDKILKARYIPPEDQTFNYFVGVSKNKVPRIENRKISIRLHNRKLSKKEGENVLRRISTSLNKQLKKIRELGIEYEFKPVHQSNIKQEKAILTLDESDEEITFKIPKNVEVIKKESSNGSSKKTNVSPKVKSVNGNAKSELSTAEKVKGHHVPKVKKKVALSKPDDSKTSYRAKGSLRGIKKSRSLKVSSKIKLNDKKKILDAFKMELAEVTSPKSFKSKWKVKESM